MIGIRAFTDLSQITTIETTQTTLLYQYYIIRTSTSGSGKLIKTTEKQAHYIFRSSYRDKCLLVILKIQRIYLPALAWLLK